MPRMTENIVLDTTIHEPSMTAGEVEMLCFALDRARAQFAWKCGGLDAAGLSRPHPPSAMTLGGLLKHLALVEDQRTCLPDRGADGAALGRGRLRGRPRLGVALGGRRLPRRALPALARSGGALPGRDGAGARRRGLDQPSKFTTPSGEHPNLRRVLVDQIEEYIRHTGHADLLREAVDGLVGEDPPQP
jgi:Protein of unknown function (DUF664)